MDRVSGGVFLGLLFCSTDQPPASTAPSGRGGCVMSVEVGRCKFLNFFFSRCFGYSTFFCISTWVLV